MKFSEVLVLVCVVGTLLAVAVPSGDVMKASHRRATDATFIRQIGQTSLIYANDNREKLPPRFGLTEQGLVFGKDDELTPSIHALAIALALSGLNDAQTWMSSEDKSRLLRRDLTFIFDGSTRTVNPDFIGAGLSFQYVAGLTTAMPFTTPIAVTRGLDIDGHWVADPQKSVHGVLGGHVVYMGGNVKFIGGVTKINWWDRVRGKAQPRGRAADFIDTQGNPTPNILETITDQQAIYSFPETPTGRADGLPGIGAPWPKSSSGTH